MPDEKNAVAVEKSEKPTTETTKESPKKGSKKILMTVVTAVVAAIVLVIVGVGIYIYVGGYKIPWVNAIARVVPYPVAVVDGHIVRLSDFSANMEIAQHNILAQKQVDIFDSTNKQYRDLVEQGVLASQIEGEVIVRLTKKYDVSVTQADIQKEEDSLLTQFKDKADFEKTIQDLFGISVADFEKQILLNQVAKQKLQKYYLDNRDLTKTERDKASEVVDKLKKGEKFDELAKKYSDDSSATQGGDLGTVARGTYDAEFEKAALALKVGETSGIVQTQFGWHVIQLVAKDDKSLHAKHILVQSKFEDWLIAEVKKANIFLLANAFQWDKSAGELKLATEGTVSDTPAGDASTNTTNSTGTTNTTK